MPSVLSNLIVIEKETTTKNAVGTPKETYEFYRECWADKVPKSGTTQYDTTGSLPFSTDDFIIRFDKEVNYKCRIIYNNNYYKIEHIDYIGRKQWMKLQLIVWDRAKSY